MSSKYDWNVYILKNILIPNTYLGATNNPEKRLEKHNGGIKKGGARYTHNHGRGGWRHHIIVSNLTKSEALSIEKTARNLRHRAKGKTPLKRRLYVLLPLLKKYEHCKIRYPKKKRKIRRKRTSKRKKRKIK